jgi:hypothetical protein
MGKSYQWRPEQWQQRSGLDERANLSLVKDELDSVITCLYKALQHPLLQKACFDLRIAHGRTSKMLRTTLNLLLLESFSLLSSAKSLTITKAPQAQALPLIARQAGDPSSCILLNSIASSCSVATASFFDQPFSVAATCLCYSGSSYQPTIYDNAIETCLQYLSTASPPLYTSLAAGGNTDSPCSSVGNVRTNTVIDTYLISCSSWYSLEASCSSDDLFSSAPPFSVQASCLCYTSSVFAPTVFDGYWDGCLEYYKTASSAYYYSTLATEGNLETPCARVGDVRASGTVATTSSSAAPGQSVSTSTVTTRSSVSATSSVSTSSSLPTGATSHASSSHVSVGLFWLLAIAIVPALELFL